MSTPSRQFVVEESWGPHYTALTLDQDGSQHQFFIENSPHDPKKPDLTLHHVDIDGPVLGLAQFRRFSSNCDVKLENEDQWIHLAKKGLLSSSYKFEIFLQGETRLLTWKKTQSLGYHRSPHGNIKLVDENNGEVLAVFSRGGFPFVPGHLDIYGSSDHGDSFCQISLLTGLAIREQQRRQTTRTVRAGRDNVYTMGAAGGGAGGGGC